MRKAFWSSRFLAVLATLFCGPILTSNLYAAGATNFTIPIVNVQFNPSNCSNLTVTQVTLNGQYHFTVHTKKNPDGTYTTKFQSEAHGTAVDNDGNQYVFNYNNHEQDITPTPADVPPALVTVTDRFGLSSKGSTPNLKVEFQEVLYVDANFNVTVIAFVAKGDPSCDPI